MTKEKKKGKIVLIICLCVFGSILLLLCSMLIVSMVTYSITHSKIEMTPATTESKMLPRDLINSDAVAFEISSTNEGPFNWDSDYWQECTYILHYNYELEIIEKYSKSGKKKKTTKVNFSDFYEIKSLAEEYNKKKEYYKKKLDYSQTMDGSTWGFSSYEPDGKKTYLYGGYIYGCTELERIADILTNYNKQT